MGCDYSEQLFDKFIDDQNALTNDDYSHIKECKECHSIMNVSDFINNKSVKEYPLNIYETEALNFIRKNVVREISTKQKKSVFTLSQLWKYSIVAASLTAILFIIIASQSSIKNDRLLSELNSEQISIINESINLIKNVMDFDANTPRIIIKLNVDETREILKKINFIKINIDNNEDLIKKIKSIEKLLLAIASISENDYELQLQLIKKSAQGYESKILKQFDQI